MALRFVTARWGDKYGPEYVAALKKQVPNLICLGDDWPFRTRLEYWWCKLEWFAPWNRGLRPAVWIDLDTYVFHVEPFKTLDPTKLWMIDDFNKPKNGESGLLLIPKDVDHIWDAVVTKNSNWRSPDGTFLSQFAHQRMNRAIDGIYSYKRHCRDHKPDDAIVCCFHGQPKPPGTKGWALDYWQEQIKD